MSKKTKSLLIYCIFEYIIIFIIYLVLTFISGNSTLLVAQASIILGIIFIAFETPAYIKGYNDSRKEN